MSTVPKALNSIVGIYKAAGRLARRFPITSRFANQGREHARLRLLQAMPKNSICAELGVWKGGFTKQILDVVRPSKLHLVDPWSFDAESQNQWFGGRSEHAKAQSDMESIYRSVVGRYGSLPNVLVHRETASAMAATFPNNYFDWIYIDGNHSYDFVRADLWEYLPKVRQGGLLAGDDYWWGPEEDLPVKRAVDEMAATGTVELRYLQRGQFILQKM